MLALPTNTPMAARCLYRTVDAIWRAAGDTATDWNFYSKRALLAGVYRPTLIYWLDDNSENLQETCAFLDRRIENVMQVPKLRGQLRTLAERAADLRRFFRTYSSCNATMITKKMPTASETCGQNATNAERRTSHNDDFR